MTFKVTAVRIVAATPAEAIEKYAVDRKEKLLDVGLKFDYAQTKGKLREFEKDHERRKRAQDRERYERDSKRSREVKMKDRRRERLRKKRIADALHEKRKIAEEKEREKRKRRRARVAERRERERERALSTTGDRGDESQVVGGATTEGEAGSDKGPITTPLSGTGSPGIDTAPTPTECTDTQPPTESKELPNDPAAISQQADRASKPNSPTGSIMQPTVKTDTTPTEALTQSLASMTLDKQRPPSRHLRPRLSGFAPTTTTFDSCSSESDSPISPIGSLHDEDFPWDSEM